PALRTPLTSSGAAVLEDLGRRLARGPAGDLGVVEVLDVDVEDLVGPDDWQRTIVSWTRRSPVATTFNALPIWEQNRQLESIAAGGSCGECFVGAVIGPVLLKGIRTAATDAGLAEGLGRPLLVDANFSGAHFTGDADFELFEFRGGLHAAPNEVDGEDQPVVIDGDAYLVGARIEGDTNLSGATIGGDANLGGATIEGNANLRSATIGGDANLSGAKIERDAYLVGATIEGDAHLVEAEIGGDANLSGAKIERDANLVEAKIGGDANLYRAKIEGNANLNGAKIDRHADLGGAKIEGAAYLSGATIERD
ncbi:MAG: pentapeptide repeat-containing protein, partial [Desulfobulbaceae bacterium]|nr:pentapeptide repeat-containing protein [Desulfobulbaceae bacterium]